jgi:hypothetical protein
MSAQQAATLQAFANLSASLLLLGILVFLVAGSAVLWLAGRGLILARREVANWAPLLLARLIAVRSRVEAEAQAQIYRPHVSRLSRLHGIRAGVAAFFRGRAARL